MKWSLLTESNPGPIKKIGTIEPQGNRSATMKRRALKIGQ